MVRELILTIPSTINETHKGGMVGRRVESYYDLSPLADPFYKILTNLWDYTKNWSYDAIYEMFKQASFIGNIMNEEMLKPRTPHQDGPMTFPKQFISSRTGFASSVFLNTPEECSGGTALYTYKGEQSPLQMPEQSVDHFITESEGDWEKIGLIENNFQYKPLVYPNPTVGDFSIDLGAIYNNVKITLTDINGRIIQFRNTLNGRFFDLKIDTSSGIYLLTVESGKNRAVIKIIKN